MKRADIPEVVAAGRSMHDGFVGDPKTFVAPNPAPSVIQGQIVALDTAQQATKSRAKGTAAARDLARDVLWTSLEAGRIYVQGLIDQNPERAAAISSAVGLHLAAAPTREKAILEAAQKHDGAPIQLAANATTLRGDHKKGVAGVYHWRQSTDRGQTWTLLESTAHADTEVTGLPADTEVWFEVCAMFGKDRGEWSRPAILKVR